VRVAKGVPRFQACNAVQSQNSLHAVEFRELMHIRNWGKYVYGRLALLSGLYQPSLPVYESLQRIDHNIRHSHCGERHLSASPIPKVLSDNTFETQV
jgi:hypothetical protein